MGARQLLVVGAFVALAGNGILLPAYSAGDTPPVTGPDQLTVLSGGERDAAVLANDSDDQDDLAVCRARTAPSDLWVIAADNRIIVNAYAATVGDYAVRYQACDYDYLSVGDLTVHVVAPRPVTVEKVAGEPFVLRATNPNPVPVSVEWGTNDQGDLVPHGSVDVGPHASADFVVDVTDVLWVARDPSACCKYYISSGEVTGISLSQPQPALRLLRRWEPAGTWSPTTVHRATPATVPDPWPSDPTTVQRPVTTPDSVHLWAGGQLPVDVLGNDSDPQGQPLDLCRGDTYGPGAAPAVWGYPTYDGTFSLSATEGATGDHVLNYYACNSGRMDPGTVTVHIERAAPLVVHRVKGHPHRVHLFNPDPGPATFYLSLGNRTLVKSGSVSAHTHTTVRVPLKRLRWSGFIGVERGFAGRGNLPQVG